MGGERWKGGQWGGQEESEGWRSHLRRADVGRRLVAADVLLARLSGHAEEGTAALLVH